MNDEFYRPGQYCDVVLTDKGFVQVVSNNLLVEGYDESGSKLFSRPVPEEFLFLRASYSGAIHIVGHGHDSDFAYLLNVGNRPTEAIKLDKTSGVTNVIVNNNRVLIQVSPEDGVFYDFNGTQVGILRHRRTSQGYYIFGDDGNVVLTDDIITVKSYRGYNLNYGVKNDGLVIGQWHDDSMKKKGIGVVFLDRELAFSRFLNVMSYEPHYLVNRERIAVVARTALGAAYSLVTPPYPPNEPLNKEDKDDKMEEKEVLDLSDDVESIVNANPNLMFPFNEENRAKLLRIIANRVNTRLGKRIGLLVKRDQGNKVPLDILVDKKTLLHYDCLTDTGPRWALAADGKTIKEMSPNWDWLDPGDEVSKDDEDDKDDKDEDDKKDKLPKIIKGKMRLRASDGRFVCADRDLHGQIPNDSRKGDPLVANRDSAGAYETFDIEIELE